MGIHVESNEHRDRVPKMLIFGVLTLWHNLPGIQNMPPTVGPAQDPPGTEPMNAEHFPKKYWSPNSPFGHTCIFSAYETMSFIHRNAAELRSLEDAMAALTENLEPKRWRAKWLVEKFAEMGMPKRLAENGQVLMFLPDFVASIRRTATDDSMIKMEDASFDKMVDLARGGNGRLGHAIWTSRPKHISKVSGAPVFKTRNMQIRFKP